MIAIRELGEAKVLASMAALGIRGDDVIYRAPMPQLLRPVLYILRDHAARLIVVCIRGTHSLKDTLTCMAGESTPFRILR